MVAGDGEVHSQRMDQYERIGDGAAVNQEMMTAGLNLGAGVGVELQPGQVEDIAQAEKVDRGAEAMVRRGAVLDLELGGTRSADRRFGKLFHPHAESLPPT